jgi:branched-chain amino acid transport system permease protein
VALAFAQTTLDGLMAGAGYALLALGFTLMFGVLRRLNLAYGAVLMLGAYVAAWLHARFGVGLLVVSLTTLAVAMLAGLYVERLCFAPLAGAAPIASLVSSFAIWMQLEEAATLLVPYHSTPFPPLLDAEVLALGPLLLRTDRLTALLVAVLAAALLWLWLHRTRSGLAVRVLADEPAAALHVGVDVAAMVRLVFAIACLLGGLAAVLILAGDHQVTAMFGMWATTKGLIAMMLGGLGSVPGAVAGGLLLGLVEAHAQAAAGPQVRDLLAWLLLFAILVLRPGGLLGRVLLDSEATARARL